MNNPISGPEPLIVDARHAGGSITVDVDMVDEIFAGCVRLEVPGSSATPLYPVEARALAAALSAAAQMSETLVAVRAIKAGTGATR